jgi:hypothetical protein
MDPEKRKAVQQVPEFAGRLPGASFRSTTIAELLRRLSLFQV